MIDIYVEVGWVGEKLGQNRKKIASEDLDHKKIAPNW